MLKKEFKLTDIISFATSNGFIFPSCEIYGRLQAVYDYGPRGVLLQQNIQNFWWKSMVQFFPNIVGLNGSILMDARVWKASGHVDCFHDWVVEDKKTKKRYRVDHLLEGYISQVKKKNSELAEKLLQKMKTAMKDGDRKVLQQLLILYLPHLPGKREEVVWGEVRKMDLMFHSKVGAFTDQQEKIYLRPETAQSIFVSFLQVQRTTRQRIPFGIAQIGSAFRNEFNTKQFLFRMREFHQMEMQFFIEPGEDKNWFDYWCEQRMKWYRLLGIPSSSFCLEPHQNLAHYAQFAVDITYFFPFGRKEIEGIHARGNFDLKNHQEYSKKKLSYIDPASKKSFLPHVIETSAGLDRIFLMLLSAGLRTGKNKKNKERIYLDLPAPLAPYKLTLCPLEKSHIFYAKKLSDELRIYFSLLYEERGYIGKRYARSDIIGTPYVATIDDNSINNDQVTVRDRNTTEQIILQRRELVNWLTEKTSISSLIKKMSI